MQRSKVELQSWSLDIGCDRFNLTHRSTFNYWRCSSVRYPHSEILIRNLHEPQTTALLIYVSTRDLW